MVSFLTVADIMGPISSRSGKKTSKRADLALGVEDHRRARAAFSGLVGLQDHLARARVDDVGRRVNAPSRSASVISISSTSSLLQLLEDARR